MLNYYYRDASLDIVRVLRHHEEGRIWEAANECRKFSIKGSDNPELKAYLSWAQDDAPKPSNRKAVAALKNLEKARREKAAKKASWTPSKQKLWGDILKLRKLIRRLSYRDNLDRKERERRPGHPPRKDMGRRAARIKEAELKLAELESAHFQSL